MEFLILIIAAYLLGSVPFGFVIAKAHGKDLRAIGSGNIGATNLSRALGKKWAYFCFCLDVAKGLVPTLVAGRLVSAVPNISELFLWLAVGCSAVLGHIFSIYLKFHGGKGVATSFGVALGIWPYYTICAAISFIVWIFVTLIWRYISLASIVASITFPVTLALLVITKNNWDFTTFWPLFTVALGIPVMVVARHRENIKRIIEGTEGKVFSKKNTTG
jgi:glycerol-3-phosphate acyltransferase PlsY